MSASNYLIVKSLNNNQFFKFVAQYLKLIGFSNVKQVLRRTEVGIDFTAKKFEQDYIVKVLKANQNLDLNLITSTTKILPLYKATGVVFFSRDDLSDFSSILPKDSEILVIGKNEIDSFLNNKFSSCLEFLDYLHNHLIRKYLKHTTKDLIVEYYRLKNELKKGYVSGIDVNLYSKFNWMLYRNRFGTWKNFLEEIGEDTDRFKAITAEDIKIEYLKVKNKLGKNTITLQDVENNSHLSEHPIKRLFGSWNNLVNEIEGYHSNSSISDKEIIDEYFRVKQKLGKKVITILDMNKHGKFTSGVAAWRFGSWTAFLHKIGEGVGKWERINDQDLIDEYFRVKKQLNKVKITWNDMLAHSKFSPSKYSYIFGNWGTFLKIVTGEITKKTYSENELINEYNRVKLILNKDVLTNKDLILNSKYSPYIYKMKFGSMKQFYDKIGETPKIYKEISADDLKLEYLRISKNLNRQKITLKEFLHLSNFSQKLIRKYFGGWNDLVKEIGVEVFKHHITDEALIIEYYRIKQEFNKEYISKEFMTKHSKIHVGTYIWRFGSWGKFLEKLGEELDYLKAKKLELQKNKELTL